MSEKHLSIAFVLPSEGAVPIGGFKVVYEYANALACRGHQVSVVHPAILDTSTTLAKRCKRLIRYAQRAVDGTYRPDSWFNIDPRVKLLWAPSLGARYIPEGDAIIATAWQTAEWVATYPQSKGRKFYLLQHLESCEGPEDRVIATWRLPLHKVVIARWLHAIAEQIGEKATYIPNGLDFKAFRMDVDPQMRHPHKAMMLYHTYAWKGSADGLAALHIAREHVPSLEVDLFGVPPVPYGLPHWIRYHRNPPQHLLRKLYNDSAIFLAPSWTEGWPLPPAEAMMSGCALIATEIGGHLEYCIQGKTALLSQPKEPPAMARGLVRLLGDQEQRIGLARSGNEYIQQFTWDRATDDLEKVLQS